MRIKGEKARKNLIIVRVNREEKETSEAMSKKAGVSTSEYMRSLMCDVHKTAQLNIYLKILEKYQKIYSELRELLDHTGNKENG